MYDVNFRVWLRKDGRFLISRGRARLLNLIQEHRSISKAAEEMGMSYRHAWGALKKIESALGDKVVYSERGGTEGGATRLTELGKDLLDRYENQVRMIEGQIENLYQRPTLTTDGLVMIDGKLLLIRRGKEPYKGSYALPGGILEYGETVEECVVREVEEETGLRTRILEMIGVYSHPDRDPRGHFISVAFHLVPVGGELRSGDDAAAAELFPLDELPGMAFDHAKIVKDFREGRFPHI